MKNALLLGLFFMSFTNGKSDHVVQLAFKTKSAACAYWAKSRSAAVDESRIYSTKSATTSAVTWKAYTCP